MGKLITPDTLFFVYHFIGSQKSILKDVLYDCCGAPSVLCYVALQLVVTPAEPYQQIRGL